MATYTVQSLERYLRSYLDIVCTLEGNCQKVPDTLTVQHHVTYRERPFGQRNEAWPLMEPKRARTPNDGKARARFLEDLHCAKIDIEQAFPRLTRDDQNIILKYFILQTHVLDELMQEYGTTSRGSMQRRAQRAVERLLRIIETYDR